MHRSRTISIPSSLRRNMCWMSAKSNMILKISGPLNSEYIQMVWSIYGFEPKSTCPLVPIMKPLHKRRTIC